MRGVQELAHDESARDRAGIVRPQDRAGADQRGTLGGLQESCRPRLRPFVEQQCAGHFAARIERLQLANALFDTADQHLPPDEPSVQSVDRHEIEAEVFQRRPPQVGAGERRVLATNIGINVVPRRPVGSNGLEIIEVVAERHFGSLEVLAGDVDFDVVEDRQQRRAQNQVRRDGERRQQQGQCCRDLGLQRHKLIRLGQKHACGPGSHLTITVAVYWARGHRGVTQRTIRPSESGYHRVSL